MKIREEIADKLEVLLERPVGDNSDIVNYFISLISQAKKELLEKFEVIDDGGYSMPLVHLDKLLNKAKKETAEKLIQFIEDNELYDEDISSVNSEKIKKFIIQESEESK